MSFWYLPVGWIASKVAINFWGAYSDRESLREKEHDTEALIQTCTAMLRTYKDLQDHPAEVPMELLGESVVQLEKIIDDARNGWTINYSYHNKKIEEGVRILERRLDLFMRALRLPRSSASEPSQVRRRARAKEPIGTL